MGLLRTRWSFKPNQSATWLGNTATYSDRLHSAAWLQQDKAPGKREIRRLNGRPDCEDDLSARIVSGCSWLKQTDCLVLGQHTFEFSIVPNIISKTLRAMIRPQAAVSQLHNLAEPVFFRPPKTAVGFSPRSPYTGSRSTPINRLGTTPIHPNVDQHT